MELNCKKIVKNALIAGVSIGFIASGCALLRISLKTAIKVFEKSEDMIDKLMDKMFEIVDNAEISDTPVDADKIEDDISACANNPTGSEAVYTSESHYRDFVINDMGNGTFKFDDGNKYYLLNNGSINSVHNLIDIIIDTRSSEECCEESEESTSNTKDLLIDLDSVPTTPWNADLDN